ncbi:serine/threonine-protein kinase pim-2-like [Takifugu rubripes]|uniref:serine/threonine-protein kinase pim-2-like n=1 Tax=Takifugu rubripes TaxID=31033 RepID=UPI0011453202|nr:serine/threonine-protein kinase pim-2-like [Takifugu rubripes]
MVLMTMAARDSVGENAAVSPLAWTELDYEVLLIMERPNYCMSLFDFNNGQIEERLAKVIMLAIMLRWTTSHRCRAQSDNIFGCSLTLLSVHQEFMRQLVEAAIEIHKAGVFHRDLKAENLLLQFYDAWRIPRVRVIDFGCGWFVTPGYCSYAGTHCFRPPEVDHRGTYEAGPTTVWQLGCILLQLLSVNTDLFVTRMQHCQNVLMYTIMELKVSEDCKKFLMSCLLVNPDQRLNLGQMLCHPWFH